MLSSGGRGTTGSIGRVFKSMTVKDVNAKVLNVSFAVKGPVEDRANQILAEIKKGEKYPFESLIPCNIGNPYAVGKPILTFPRQVLAAAEFPGVIKDGTIPAEAAERALRFINNNPSSMGAYSHLQGHLSVREEVADFIKRRDGFDSDPEKIYLAHGATSAIVEVFHTFINGPKDGVIIPVPQYPLYSALVNLHGATLVPYYLDESKDWSFNADSLLDSLKDAKEKGVSLKCMVVINPGNPTGTVLTTKDIHQIIDICEEEGILLIADEVYQENVYGDQKWTSFKKEACKKNSKVQLMSLHSISKGFVGECGHRGGYVELHNIDDGIKEQLHKLFSLSICPNTAGQLMLSVCVNPPKSSECGDIWKRESARELASLGQRANTLYHALNKLPGMSARRATGAMYLYPSLHLPKKAIEASKVALFNGKHIAPDLFWALQLLNEEGIMVTPGSGFGQVEGTHHFRTTFLPDEKRMDEVITRLTRFQTKFMEKYE